MRPCRRAGCAGLSPTGWCNKHQTAAKVQKTQLERYRGSAASRGYDAAWRKVRLIALKRDSYLCQCCLRLGRVTPAQDVDHVIPFASLDDPLRLDIDNLESLCRSCHNMKTARQQR